MCDKENAKDSVLIEAIGDSGYLQANILSEDGDGLSLLFPREHLMSAMSLAMRIQGESGSPDKDQLAGDQGTG